MIRENSAHNRVYIEIDSRAENIGLVRLAIASLAATAHFSVADVEEIRVAVSEALSNCVLHAYPDGPGVIRVTADLGPGGLALSVADDGKGMEDIEQCRKAEGRDDPERLGLGFMFMESLMDSLEIESRPGRGTIVRMFKSVSGADKQGG